VRCVGWKRRLSRDNVGSDVSAKSQFTATQSPHALSSVVTASQRRSVSPAFQFFSIKYWIPRLLVLNCSKFKTYTQSKVRLTKHIYLLPYVARKSTIFA